MFLTDFIKESIEKLGSIYPSSESRSIVMMLCESVLGTKNYTHIVEPAYEIPVSKEEVLNVDVQRLMQGEPIQYVIGKGTFCGLDFQVTRDVLIPRPETEMLCKEAIKIGNMIYRMRSPYGKKAKPVTILDLCTGSGCIAWTLALSVPTAKVTAVDISEKALEVARNQNFIQKMKGSNAVAPVFYKVDILGEEFPVQEKFDIILSNPPYIMNSEKTDMRKNVLEYEPEIALFVPDEDPLLFYKSIAKWSNRLMEKEGFGMTEINEKLGKETESVFKKEGFSNTDITKDFYDKDRFIIYRRQS